MNRETRMPLADGRPLVETMRLQTFTLELIGPRADPGWMTEIQVSARLMDALEEAQENLTDQLPEGYSVRISEWSAE